MSVYFSAEDHRKKWGGLQPLPHGDCFYCGKKMKYPVVTWMGSTGEINLHPDCVLKLSVRLFRDVHEVQRRAT